MAVLPGAPKAERHGANDSHSRQQPDLGSLTGLDLSVRLQSFSGLRCWSLQSVYVCLSSLHIEYSRKQHALAKKRYSPNTQTPQPQFEKLKDAKAKLALIEHVCVG